MPSFPAVSGELALLLQNSGGPCVSMILPALSSFHGQSWRTTLAKARHELQLVAPNAASERSRSLEQLLHDAELKKSIHGMGLFVSSHVAQCVSFPFPVQEKIIIDTQFHLREVLYKNQYASPYLLLQLETECIQLFAGRFQDLEEIRDELFPMQFNPVDTRSGLKEQGPTAATIDTSRQQLQVLTQEIDNRLNEYFRDDTVLVVCGDHRLSTSFLNHSAHAGKLIGVFHGNYGSSNVSELAIAAWPTVKGWLEERMEESVSTFEEKIGEGKAVSGIDQCWTAILEERGLQLLVEKDYQVPAYLENNSRMLFMKPPPRPYRMLQDAADVLIPLAFAKKLPVIIVGNGMLHFHNHIALVTRY